MNGYDAQDMAAQGADGFRNGYQAGYADAVKAIEAAQPAAAQESAPWRDHDAAIDAKALSTATEIALMWGQDRSQFISRIQVAVIDAMRWVKGGLQPAAAQEAVAWVKTKPASEGDYYVRGFNLFAPKQYEALVQVRMHHFAGEPAPELVCNLHESTSSDDMDDWSPIVEMSDDFEWMGPLFAAPVTAAPANDLQWLVDGLDEIGSLSRNLRQGGCDAGDLEGLENGLMHAVDMAHQLRDRLLALIDASHKGGGEAASELRIWGIQKPDSMPKLFGVRHLAELNWYPDEGYDLICMQVVDRVPARAEIHAIRAQAQAGDAEVQP